MSIRSYNAFLKAVRRKHGLTQKQAQKAYRGVSSRLNRPAKGVDAKKHPGITADEARKSARKRATSPKSGASKPKGKGRIIRSIGEWRRLYHADGGYSVKVVSSADYGRGRRGRR